MPTVGRSLFVNTKENFRLKYQARLKILTSPGIFMIQKVHGEYQQPFPRHTILKNQC